ncbi:hypothetical protein O3G_MSEX012836 [Manduca sexta]|uniref:DDB1- and CUL4-associated factor 8 n=1 Tax=Manduca sexta TaxID=7130 RepID=A0A921ZQW3_MANSE|nr:hypothetical protein O3G_MSEX012836 [Manduca sexta]
MTEINSSSGDDIEKVQYDEQSTSSPKTGGKKAKLNDGTARDVGQQSVIVSNVKELDSGQLVLANNAEEHVQELVIVENEENLIEQPAIVGNEDENIVEGPENADNEEENVVDEPVNADNEEGNVFEEPVNPDNEEKNVAGESVITENEQNNVIEDSVTADNEENIIEELVIADNEEEHFGEQTVMIDTEEENVAEQTVITDNDDNIFPEISESTNGDEWIAGNTEDPINEVIIPTPSTSAQALLMDMPGPSTSTGYRKRNTPHRHIDDDSLDDSDLSPDENYSLPRLDNTSNFDSNTDMETDDINRALDLGISSSDDEEEGLDNSDEITDDDDDDDDAWSRSNDDTYSDDGAEDTPPVLLKQRPKHKYSMLKEVLKREIGLTSPRGTTTKDDAIFAQRFYSSLHAVFRMEKVHSLNKHRGCVNSINFHPEGHLLASGSDDTTVIIWDWARRIPLHTVKTGHKSNVFQSKFLNFNSSSQLNIVTCARDGQVRLAQCGSAGGSWSRRRLAAHGKAANKLHVTPLEPHSVLSAGEDGFVLHCDLRVDTVNKVIQVKERNAAVALYSLHGHPFDSKQLVVAGRDKFVRVYDRRKATKPIAIYCPSALTEESTDIKKTMRLSAIHLTCAVYNHDGTEILASYSDDDIYLFNTKTDEYNKDAKDGYSRRYSGHRNSATLKGVTYFGPKSEYILSGSDCGYIYMWEKHTESIVQWRQGDANGMVNIVEPHPRFPILASGGLDKDVKIWAPYSNEDPNYHGLSSTIRLNTATNWQSPLFNDFLPTLYRSWRGENSIVVEAEDLPYGGNVEFEANICTTF